MNATTDPKYIRTSKVRLWLVQLGLIITVCSWLFIVWYPVLACFLLSLALVVNAVALHMTQKYLLVCMEEIGELRGFNQ